MLNLLNYDPFRTDLNYFERFGEDLSSCLGCPPKGKDIEEDAERLDALAAFMRQFKVTFFLTQYAKEKDVKFLTLHELRELIEKTSKRNKKALPWLKLATFGDKRSPKGSYRYNDNMLTITGVEGEHDAGAMTFEEAVRIAGGTGLLALLYTSPSHTSKKPRWRILCPTSKPLPSGERAKLLARINGIYDGAITPESFAASQAFYFGSVNHNPDHEAVIVEGDFIDERTDLDDGAIGKGRREDKGNGSSDEPTVFEQFAREKTEKSYEPPSLEEVEAALKVIPPTHKELGRKYFVIIGHAVHSATEGSADGLKLFDDWRQRGPYYDAEKVAEKWEGFRPTDVTFGTLVHYADEADENWRDKIKEPVSEEKSKQKLMQTSAQFVAGYVPPDYLIDSLLQRRYVYSFTAPTGSGKTAIALLMALHVALGLPLADKQVEKGRVLFFAGENPDDVRSRWIKLCEEMKQDHDMMDVIFMPFTLDLAKNRKQIDEEAKQHGPFALLIVDTSASYNTGNDENDNVQLGNHARMLRTFIDLPGGPTVLVTCHPTKTPNMENLLPRGGGAFLAEVDGNLVAVYDQSTRVAEVTTHGKFRGPEFAPFSFKLVAGKSEKLVDTKGRSIWSVFARSISDAEMEAVEAVGHSDQDDVLRNVLDHPGLSLTGIAEHLFWNTMDGKPNKQKVHRILRELTKSKLVEKQRGGRYALTNKGTEEAEKIPQRMSEERATGEESHSKIRF